LLLDELGGGGELGHTRTWGSPFIGAGREDGRGAHTKAEAAAACRATQQLCCAFSPDGLLRAGGPGWRWVGLADAGSAQKDRIGIFISEFIFNAKTIPVKTRNCIKAEKTPKITETPWKFPETDGDTNNPNKVFGAHGKKILEPSNK
jgi:hypothetical protein